VRHIRYRLRQSVFILVCGVLLAGLAATQTLPPVHSVTRQGHAAQTPTGAAPSPTPVLRPSDPAGPPRLKSRDLARYDKAGPFNVGADRTGGPVREAVMSQARAFLLEHWRGRRLGHLVINSSDAEGRPAASAFYVEPDEGGRWAVVRETAGGSETFRFVEEVEVPEDGPPLLGEPSEGVRPPAVRMGLHLKQSESANSGLVL
jgi:hypothetical protein